jgi:hypothetical protein
MVSVIFASSIMLSACSKNDTEAEKNDNEANIEECIKEGEEGEIYPGAPSCCAGLSGITCDEPDENGNCQSCSETFICTNCGNGECGDAENKCNCPTDCQ